MRTVTACVLAMAAAILLASVSEAADPAGALVITELDVADRVVEVKPFDGMAMVFSDMAGYQVRAAAGTLEVAGAIVIEAVGDRRERLLPQSRTASGNGSIREVWLSDATDRYGHGVLGDRLEAASLRVRLVDGAVLVLPAGDDAVFEDLVPRLADLDGNGPDEILIVKSYLDRGAALAVIGLNAVGELAVLAETPPIGRPNRWLNPVGAADFDGDGAVEIAYVETPHIGGTLMVWEWRGGALVREHAEPGFSNHAIGSTELGMAAIVDIDGDGLMDLAIPGRDRDRLRLISLAGGVVREIADIDPGGVIGTAIAPVGRSLVFGLEDGRLLALRF